MPVTSLAQPQARTLFRALFERVLHALQEGVLSRPSRLLQVLREHPYMRVQIADSDASIDARSVVRWHEWGDPSLQAWPHGGRGTVSGWRAVDGGYHMFTTTIPALMAFAKCHSTIEWSCEIQELSGFTRSTSDLSQFLSLDALVQRDARELISDVSPAGLARNLDHPGIGILNGKRSTDHFVSFAWDRRVFLDNTGGSHHLAAARFIARRLGKAVMLPGLMRSYAVSKEAVSRIAAEFEVFAISNELAAKQAFHEAMRSFKATYLLHRLPDPIDDAVAVLLPRSDRRSAVVAAAMRSARMTDVGAHLASVCERQVPVLQPSRAYQPA